MTQEQAFDIMKMGESVFLTGAAGSGKTYLLNSYIRFLRERNIPVAVTASTGIAATHMNGITLHSWAGFGIRDLLSAQDVQAILKKKRYRSRVEKTKVLIIDEVSMLHDYHLDMTDALLRAGRNPWKSFGGLQIILCGDFFQLPPVGKDKNSTLKFAYESSAWRGLNPAICYLEEQYRQEDLALLRVLSDIRANTVSEDTRAPLRTRWQKPIQGDINPTKLFAHNADVDTLNVKELERITGQPTVYRMESHGSQALVSALKDGCLAPEELALKKGATVMFVKNNFERGYINGTLGCVVDFDEDTEYPVVETRNGKRIAAEPADWSVEEEGKIKARITQIPLRLAWAITIHKSQGMTLDAAEIDLSKTFERGMGYVALSRVRALTGLMLTGMNELAFLVNEKIAGVDVVFQEKSNEAQKMIEELLPEEKREKELQFLKSLGVRTWTEKSEYDMENSENERVKSYSVDEARKGHPSVYLPWSEEEDERLENSFLAGIPIAELVQIHGRKPGGIMSRLKKLGLGAPEEN
ncbi:MAG: AAA ATPase [Parcubacteria group bacterium Gr01-1014_29]|nr:MAG: AAA ATPase [Parcubacteria group bacterium Gr01-1014_29]